jgi:hypothetical protein
MNIAQIKAARKEKKRLKTLWENLASIPRSVIKAFMSSDERAINRDNEDARRVAQMLRFVSRHTGSKLGPTSRGVTKLTSERS